MLTSILGALALVLAQTASLSQSDGLASPDPAIIAGAEAGDPEALFELAVYRLESLSATGLPDPVEVSTIRALLIQAADQGHGGALNMLGTIAEADDTGDLDPAISYYERAHAAGDASGSINLGVALLQADAPGEQQRGVDILQRISEGEGADPVLAGVANGYLGYALSIGAGEEAVDYVRGQDLLLLGHQADPENSDFNFLLGRYFEHGLAGPADPQQAAHYFIAAGEAGHSIAAWKAGMAYLNGDGVEINELEAFRFVNISARNGYDRGMISLAVMNALGQGIPVNPVQAQDWYSRAAALGNAHALRGFGLMLLRGEAGEAEPATGYALITLAAEAGDAIAGQALEQLAPQIPDSPEWAAAVSAARARFLESNGLTPADLYGAEE